MGTGWIDSLGIRAFTSNCITTLASTFKEDYFERVGRFWDVEFEYVLNGNRILALGDDVPSLSDMDGQVIVVREIGYKLGR